ncbi:MAG: hypothetical protein CEO21_78 [Microgenomates group bacterium Gr01-1014_80]|nr:MAG: hypothetical protein CEO21_78 [Microgenomates group bacterium Gr01-1014_80]
MNEIITENTPLPNPTGEPGFKLARRPRIRGVQVNGSLINNLRLTMEPPLSQEELGQRVGLKHQTISNIERKPGYRVFPETAQNMAAFFGIPVDELIIDRGQLKFDHPKPVPQEPQPTLADLFSEVKQLSAEVSSLNQTVTRLVSMLEGQNPNPQT